MNKKVLLFVVIGICIVLALLGYFVDELGFFKVAWIPIGFMGCWAALFLSAHTKVCPHCFRKVPDQTNRLRIYGYVKCPECNGRITAYYEGKNGPSL